MTFFWVGATQFLKRTYNIENVRTANISSHNGSISCNNREVWTLNKRVCGAAYKLTYSKKIKKLNNYFTNHILMSYCSFSVLAWLWGDFRRQNKLFLNAYLNIFRVHIIFWFDVWYPFINRANTLATRANSFRAAKKTKVFLNVSCTPLKKAWKSLWWPLSSVLCSILQLLVLHGMDQPLLSLVFSYPSPQLQEELRLLNQLSAHEL